MHRIINQRNQSTLTAIYQKLIKIGFLAALNLKPENLHIIASSKHKTIELQICCNGQICLRLPKHISQKEICQFLIRKRDWLAKHTPNNTQQLLEINQKIGAGQELLQLLQQNSLKIGKPFLFLGKSYILQTHSVETSNSLETIQNDMQGQISYPTCTGKNLKQDLEKALRQAALKLFQVRCEQYYEQYFKNLLALQPLKKIKVRKYKARWGCCSPTGDITFNWQLIFAPLQIIDYVVVHELAHLIEFNHSQYFWALVEQFMPDYKKYKQWLRYCGHYLLRF